MQLGKLKPEDKTRELVGDRSNSGVISGLPVVSLFHSLSLPLLGELTSYQTAALEMGLNQIRFCRNGERKLLIVDMCLVPVKLCNERFGADKFCTKALGAWARGRTHMDLAREPFLRAWRGRKGPQRKNRFENRMQMQIKESKQIE